MPVRSKEQMIVYVSQLATLWAENPELRFGQFIANAISPKMDPYYLEDHDLLKQVRDFYSTK